MGAFGRNGLAPPGLFRKCPDHDCDRALAEDQQLAGPRTGSEHGFPSLVGCQREGGEALLEKPQYRVSEA